MTQPTLARIIVCASVAFLLTACADIPNPPSAPQAPRVAGLWGKSDLASAQADADQAIIELKGAESSTFQADVEGLGGQIDSRLPQMNFVITRGLTPDALAAISSRSDVASVTPDVSISWIPNITPQTSDEEPPPPSVTGPDQSSAFFFRRFQWNMRVTHANDAWTATPAGNGASVYVLDTGVDPGHIDLAGVIDVSKSRSFVASEPDIFDRNFHGTFVSAIIASKGIGVASVAPLAKVVAVKVLRHSDARGTFADLIRGIVYAADQGADVINMSLGFMADLNNPVLRQLVAHLQAAVTYARFKGSVVVAGGGNDGVNLVELPRNLIFVPAELAGVIGVGATAPVNQQNFDMLASYSNYGSTGAPFRGGVRVFAPGGDLVPGGSIFDLIVSACSRGARICYLPDGRYHPYILAAGTSASSPMVAGDAAVIRSILGGSHEDEASSANVRCVLKGTDDIGPRSIFGHGRINLVKAAACASRNDGEEVTAEEATTGRDRD